MRRWKIERVNKMPITIEADLVLNVTCISYAYKPAEEGEIYFFTGQIAGKTVNLAIGDYVRASEIIS